ncbi:MAG TPA: CpsB/CapC family capsule biosynthesis tyrosine phosphatase [Sphingobacteriaceae bacterium]
MLFNFFKSKPKEPEVNFGPLRVDLHSHLIPGIDDGAQNVHESVVLVRKMMDLGFEKIIATPHVMADFYRNTPETINRGLDLLREELAKQHIGIQVEAAAEYYLDEAFEAKLSTEKLLTIGDNFVLFELSFVNYPQNLFDIIEQIKDKGYKPILAHPERYGYLFGSIENYQKIKETGCYLQLNTISLAGYYGKPSQRMAQQLVDNYLVDFIASDMHHLKHADALKQALHQTYVQKLITEYQLQNSLLI